MDGRVKGDTQDLSLVGGQLLKANSITDVESTKSQRVYIKSIIAIVDH
jgi:hypothetical protein